MCEFLEEPPAQVIHPEYGKGVFKEIDKDLGTFIYKFEGVTAEVSVKTDLKAHVRNHM